MVSINLFPDCDLISESLNLQILLVFLSRWGGNFLLEPEFLAGS
jgi:hypothetical protein